MRASARWWSRVLFRRRRTEIVGGRQRRAVDREARSDSPSRCRSRLSLRRRVRRRCTPRMPDPAMWNPVAERRVRMDLRRDAGAELRRLAGAAAESLRRPRRSRRPRRRRTQRGVPACSTRSCRPCSASSAQCAASRACGRESRAGAADCCSCTTCRSGSGALGLAAVFSAEVSAADAVLFMLATSLSQDLYKRFVNPAATDRQVLTVARAGVGRRRHARRRRRVRVAER